MTSAQPARDLAAGGRDARIIASIPRPKHPFRDADQRCIGTSDP
jgi:hypothetical protein